MLLSKFVVFFLPFFQRWGFNPYFSGCFSLRRMSPGNATDMHIHSFNPYFSGCFSLRLDDYACGGDDMGFNPYFSGCFSLRKTGSE